MLERWNRIDVQRLSVIHKARDCPPQHIIVERSVTAACNLNCSIGMSIETAGMPTIDMRSISQLAEGDEMGDQFVAEIIDVFLADLSERVRTIGLQMSQNDRAGVAATAHAIKGSCGHFGAARLMELCRDLEDWARRESGGDIEIAIFTMVAETERVLAALEAYKSEHSRS
jgi:histidine phosphotransfer protein HptB